jgi:hypothetical protein
MATWPLDWSSFMALLAGALTVGAAVAALAAAVRPE